MSLADDFSDLLGQRAEFSREMIGRDSDREPQQGIMEETVGALPFSFYFSSGKAQENLDAMLVFKDVNDYVLRVAKTEQNFSAVIGKTVRLIAVNYGGGDLIVIINEIQGHPVNPEYVVGCKASP